jgi:hypothetical protein
LYGRRGLRFARCHRARDGNGVHATGTSTAAARGYEKRSNKAKKSATKQAAVQTFSYGSIETHDPTRMCGESKARSHH